MQLYEINLTKNANFKLSTTIEDELLELHLKTLENKTYLNLKCNNKQILQGYSIKSNISVTEHVKYLGIKGDLIFYSSNNKNLDYKEFNDKIRCVYII